LSADPIREALQARLGAQYAIEGLLGQGGMGSVYKARDLTLDRLVAIKVISGDMATNPQLKERFLLEARTVAKLRHPNIVAVYSAGDLEGLLYFVMELVPGESLRDLLAREGKVEPARAERVLHELALALDYAHANGIVHRDVKPENILLDGETGRAMLTDFGVARALEGDGRMTGTGMILGSPRYMSPEQATGEGTLDGRSDLYALALVGYEMFTGKPVVESGNIAGMLVKHLTETPKPLAEAAERVPEGAATAIDRALAKDRDQRWRTGREMAEVIGMAWTPTPGSGTRSALTGLQIPRTKAGRRKMFGIAGTAAVALIASVWALVGGSGGGDPRRSYAVVPFDIQSGNSDVQWLRDGAVNMLTMALQQWTDLTVVDYERTLTLVRDAGMETERVDLDRAREVARRGGAGTLVMGQVSTTGDSLLVTARLYDVRSGKPLNTVNRSAAVTTDPRPLFEDLARYLLDVAGGSGTSSSANVELARATTTSLRAYRAYLDGVKLLNSWQLRSADSAFRVAIRADSTFALAWHKRALALGWGDGADSAYLVSARTAMELSDRLPARAQALVRGHFHLASGLSAQLTGGSGREGYREAQRVLTELLATDSLVAEGWYGLADAYFHDNAPNDSLPAIERRLTNSVRAFNRTLELDSTFHLAYSHLVQQYTGLAQTGNGFVLVGDSVVWVNDPAPLQRHGGPAGVAALRAQASDIGLEMTKGWARTDADAAAPYLALAQAFVSRNFPDSSVLALERALARPALNTAAMQLARAGYQLLAEDPRAFASMQAATERGDVASLKNAPATERMFGLILAINTAGSVGNGAELDRVVALFSEVQPTFPYSPQSTAEPLRWVNIGMKVGITGVATAQQRQILAAGAQRLGAGQPTMLMQQILNSSGSVVYTAYLATRDTVFSQAIRRLSQQQAGHTDLEALEALTLGDTARARTLAQTYTHPDSLRTARFSFAGLRVVARAEVLEAVGNTDWAIRYYEALDPRRMNANGLGDPGFAAYTRSYAARARLYEDRGDRTKAIAAWEEFIRRTEAGDELIAPQRREARAALQRLRDGGRR
jgi:TolB-like protein/tetratricopeptide (TPR) repeat protein